jgi:hypothetical protein
MPTYGWVHEDAWEAFLAATSVVPDLIGPERPTYPCPFCIELLASSGALHEHIAARHRIDRPILLISGREPASESVVRTRYGSAGFVVANATSMAVEINGVPHPDLGSAALAGKLAGLRHGTAIVSLLNASQVSAAPVSTAYRLSFRIADARSLELVEQAFPQAS